MPNYLIILLFYCLLLGTFSVKSEQATLTVGYTEFPPFTYTNDQGQADGFLLKKAQQVIKRAGYQIKYRALPTKRLKKYLATGKIDLWLAITPSLAEKQALLVGMQPLSIIKLNLYSLNDISSAKLTNLTNESVIILRGYSYGGVIDYINNKKHNINVQVSNTHESALDMLASGHGDYLLAYQQPTEQALQSIHIKHLYFNNLSNLPIYFILSKKVLHAEKILMKLEEVLLEMVDSGESIPYQLKAENH